ncbi:alpha/beta hydrolase [Halococcus sp. IIIV-5B]|uniref:alpha/beta hydrolase n=1 Tax=Halococcus sp. IIIV-5B TaxID=2321230 RepID=UPI000E71BCD4|nr:alpha/beta hydrolase [Halococcus sp. IIIV-5B]RJT07105.1 alpha/beta hydrolase [Halococcus sp. IIIV-5B]
MLGKNDVAVSVYEGITYAHRDAGELKLDLYVPDIEAPSLVVYLHGGGWIMETRTNIPDPKRYAAEMGIAIASVDYRLSEIPEGAKLPFEVDPENPVPRGDFPNHFVDVKASIRWLRAHAEEYGYDATQIATWGASAGGHLALLAGVVDDVTDLAGDAFPDADFEKSVAPHESSAIQAVVSWYGPTDFSGGPDDQSHPASLLLGGPKSEREDAYMTASPITHVSLESPPMLLIHGREDGLCPVEHSRRLFETLDENSVDAAFYELYGVDHTFVREGEELNSERNAMDRLTAEPTPAQSIRQTTHVDEGATGKRLIRGTPIAGPAAIARFLDRTIG